MSTPTTEFGFSYEYAVDIDTSDTGTTPTWTSVRFISAVDPKASPVPHDGQTYDDKGAPNQIKTSESWSLSFTIQQHRLPDGKYLPEVEKLLALGGPDAVGNKSAGRFRWYDNPAGGAPNPADAFEGVGTVEINRQNTGNDAIGGWSVTLTGRGRRTQIVNPKTTGTGGGG